MDWIKTGWGESFSQDFDPHKSYHIDFGPLHSTTKPLLEVSKRVITEITQKFPAPYYLYVSGGIDSQLVLWCWMNSEIDFTPVSVRYVGAPEFKEFLNEHDLTELESFTNAHNILVEYKDFDVIQFLESDLETYATKYQCTSPQLCTHMAISELVTDGTVIFSGNFAQHAFYNYTILGLHRYADISKRNMIPFFLLHDQELATINLPSDNIQDFNKRKIQTYQNLGVPVVPQPRKQTGFEVIKDYYDTRADLVVPVRLRLKYANMPSKRKFDLLFRYSLMEKIKYVDKVVYIRHNEQ